MVDLSMGSVPVDQVLGRRDAFWEGVNSRHVTSTPVVSIVGHTPPFTPHSSSLGQPSLNSDSQCERLAIRDPLMLL